jgi:hypothetical protein
MNVHQSDIVMRVAIREKARLDRRADVHLFQPTTVL